MKHIDVSIVMPQSERYRYKGSFSKYLRAAPPGLPLLAALALQVPEVSNVQIIDEGVEYFDPHTLNADIVGITCITPTAHRAYEISRILRSRGITVVMGGVHPTLVPDEVSRHADVVVVGYAEQTWPQLLRDFSKGELKSLYVEPTKIPMDNLPIPRRDLLKKGAYVTMNTLQATKGCPHRCSFCVVPLAQKGYIHRPVHEVIAEIEAMPGNTFLFMDLSPIENRKYALKLYRELAPLKKRWGGLATVRIANDPELLAAASKSGCRGLLIGLESVMPETITGMKKTFNKPSQYKEIVRRLHDHGIAVNGCFVLGLDGDDESVFERTVELAVDAAIDLPRFAVATPFPGTPLYHELKANNRLLHEDWRYYDTQHVVFKPTRMTPERLQEGLVWTWQQAYSASSSFKRIVGSAASRRLDVFGTSLLANIGYKFYARFLPDFVPMPCEHDPWKEGKEGVLL